MKRIEQIEKISDKKFQRIFGVERNTFFIMLDKLNQQFIESHKRGGHQPKINMLNHRTWKILQTNMKFL